MVKQEEKRYSVIFYDKLSKTVWGVSNYICLSWVNVKYTCKVAILFYFIIKGCFYCHMLAALVWWNFKTV